MELPSSRMKAWWRRRGDCVCITHVLQGTWFVSQSPAFLSQGPGQVRGCSEERAGGPASLLPPPGKEQSSQSTALASAQGKTFWSHGDGREYERCCPCDSVPGQPRVSRPCPGGPAVLVAAAEQPRVLCTERLRLEGTSGDLERGLLLQWDRRQRQGRWLRAWSSGGDVLPRLGVGWWLASRSPQADLRP